MLTSVVLAATLTGAATALNNGVGKLPKMGYNSTFPYSLRDRTRNHCVNGLKPSITLVAIMTRPLPWGRLKLWLSMALLMLDMTLVPSLQLCVVTG